MTDSANLPLPAVRLRPPADTCFELQVADVTIPVTVRHQARANARATIGARGLLIRLPSAAGAAACDEDVAFLLRWAVRTIGRDPQRYRPRAPRRYRDGDLLSAGGDRFRLRIAPAARVTNGVRLAGLEPDGARVIRILLAARQTAAARQHALPRLVSRGLALAKEPELRQRVAALNEQFFRGRLGTVRFRFTRNRWGSCSAGGNISISTRALLAPGAVFDYVLIHELAHLVEFNHSPRFWQAVAAAAPDYRRHQAWLRRHHRDCQF